MSHHTNAGFKKTERTNKPRQNTPAWADKQAASRVKPAGKTWARNDHKRATFE